MGAGLPTAHVGAADHTLDDDHRRAPDDHNGAAHDNDGAANHDHVPRAGDDHNDDGRVCVDGAPHPALTYTPGR